MRKINTTSLLVLLLPTITLATEVNFKGFVKGEIVNSDQGVGSYGNTYSHVATTKALRTDMISGAAASDQEKKYLSSSATSFQTAQSRFSLNVKSEKLKGIIEFDLLDAEEGFTSQSPIQSQGPRTRLAFVTYNLNDNISVFIGQKWSTAAAIKGIGNYNYVGNGFQAGNTGFLAEELGVTYKNAAFSSTIAFTGKGKNVSSNGSNTGVNQNELGAAPGIAFDLNYSGSSWVTGLAGHGAQLNFEDTPTYSSGENSTSFFAVLYGSISFGKFKLFGEAYSGHGLNNLNALGVGAATKMTAGVVSESIRESGFWTTLKFNLTDTQLMSIGVGQAKVDSDHEDSLSDMSMNKNQYAFISYTKKLTPKLNYFLQATQHKTAWGSDAKEFSANVVQSGMQVTF